MREMKDSGVEWIGKIPSSWGLETIKQLMIERNEKNREGQTDVILSLSAKDGITLYDGEHHAGNRPREDLSDYKVVHAGDIVVNSMNILSESVGLSQYNGCVSPVYYIYYSRGNGSQEYFHYVFQSREFQLSLWGLGNGILIKESGNGNFNTIRMRIPAQKLGMQIFPVPPRKQQDAIVKTLDSQIIRVDTLISNVQAQIEKLKAYKQSLITEVVTKGLDPTVPMKDSGVEWIGQVNAKFDIAPIGSLFSIRKDIIGKEPDCVLSITQQGLRVKDITQNEGQMAQSYDKYQFVHIGDFAMNHMDLLTGWIDISKFEGVTSPDYRVFVMQDKNMVAEYFLYVFQSYYKNKIFYAFGQGAANMGRWRLPAANFKKVAIPVPPVSEQKAIVEYLDEKCAQIDRLIAMKQQKIEKLNLYKKSLIYEYVTGKREVE